MFYTSANVMFNSPLTYLECKWPNFCNHGDLINSVPRCSNKSRVIKGQYNNVMKNTCFVLFYFMSFKVCKAISYIMDNCKINTWIVNNILLNYLIFIFKLSIGSVYV